jgi:tetratricopeptide (TPR) repeat protein/transglutaminase-like putative cysteine protease
LLDTISCGRHTCCSATTQSKLLQLDTLIMRVALIALSLASVCAAGAAVAQTAPQYSLYQDPSGYEIEYLLTRYEFESDGTGERRFAARARILTESGVQQVGQLLFGYAAENETYEVKNVTVHKATGEVVVAGKEAVQDRSSPVALEAPVYTDWRLIHVTVPSLSVGDTVEYEVSIQTHVPLARNHFWLEHSFEKGVVVREEVLEIDIPADVSVQLHDSSGVPAVTTLSRGRRLYRWTHSNDTLPSRKQHDFAQVELPPPEIQLTTFTGWQQLGDWYAGLLHDRVEPSDEVAAKARELVRGLETDADRIKALYDYVATEFRYVSLSFGLGRLRPHAARDVLANGYGDCKDKHTLLAALLKAVGYDAYAALIHTWRPINPAIASPAQFDHMVTAVPVQGELYWMDTTTELAPFRFLSYNLRGSTALVIRDGGNTSLVETPADPPFPSLVTYDFNGEVSTLGRLTGHVTETYRGDSELVLRVALRSVPKDQLDYVVGMAAAAEGLPGEVSNESLSDPKSTDAAFELSYDLAVTNYVDWTQQDQTVAPPLQRLIFPQFREDADSLEFGSPLQKLSRATLTLPPGYDIRAPVPVSVVRDYASYESTYQVQANELRVERTEEFKTRSIGADRISDYTSFRRALMADAGQTFALHGASVAPPNPDSITDVAALHDAGYAAYESGEYEQAIKLLSRVVELDPDHPQAWNNLGNALYEVGRDLEAVDAYQRQIEVEPFHEWAHNNLGRALRSLRRFEEAEASFRRQLEINPLDEYANGNLGSLYNELERYDEAVQYLERATSITPEDDWAFRTLAAAYQGVHRLDDALAASQKALVLDSTDVRNFHRLALVQIDRDEDDAAYQVMVRALKLAPDDSRTRAVFGRAAFYSQRIDEAKEAYESLRKTDPFFLARSSVDRGIWELLRAIP